MADNIQFQNEWRSSSYSAPAEGSKMVRLIMKYSGGAIQSEEQANYILLGAAVLFFLLTVYFMYSAFASPSVSNIQPPPAIMGGENI